MLTYVEEKKQFEIHSFVQMLDDKALRDFVLDAAFNSVEFADDEPEKVLF